MSTQQNEMRAWFFLRIRGGNRERRQKFEMGRAPLRENRFFFLGKKTPKKRLPFPHARAFSPPPHDLDCVGHFGLGNLHSCSKQNHSDFEPFTIFSYSAIWTLDDFGFLVWICFLSHFLLFVSSYLLVVRLPRLIYVSRVLSTE